MKNKYFLRLFKVIVLTITLFSSTSVSAQDKSLVVRIARLQIDSAQLENYKSALKIHAKPPFGWNRAFLHSMQFMKRITRLTLQYSKFTPVRMTTKHIWKPPILKLTRVRRRAWLNHWNLSPVLRSRLKRNRNCNETFSFGIPVIIS